MSLRGGLGCAPQRRPQLLSVGFQPTHAGDLLGRLSHVSLRDACLLDHRAVLADGPLERSPGEQSGKGLYFGWLQRIDLQVSAQEPRYDLQVQRNLEVGGTTLSEYFGEVVERDGEIQDPRLVTGAVEVQHGDEAVS